MRKMIRLSEQEDMWFPADDRIYIGINRPFSSSVNFFPVAGFKYKYEPRRSESCFSISIEEDVTYAFLGKKYLIPLLPKKLMLIDLLGPIMDMNLGVLTTIQSEKSGLCLRR